MAIGRQGAVGVVLHSRMLGARQMGPTRRITGALGLAASIAVALYAGPVSANVSRAEPCDGPGIDPWVSEVRERLLTYNSMVNYAVGRFGPPLTCEGSVTSEFDGAQFGTLQFEFAQGVTFQLKTQPPETSVTTLRAPKGLEEDTMRALLEGYSANVGVQIDWSASTVTTQGAERTESYWDPDEGLNASASLVFRGDTVVAVRFSIAL